MFYVWDSDGLGDAATDYAAKYRAKYGKNPPAGPGSAGTYDPLRRPLTRAEQEAATAISRRLHPDWNVKASDCASVDMYTGECASFTSPQPGATSPYLGAGGGDSGSGGSGGDPTRSIDQMPGGGFACSYPAPPQGCNYERGPNYVAATNCGLSLKCSSGDRGGGGQSGGSDGGTVVKGPTQTSPSGTQTRTRYRRQVVELCPLSGYVTRPIPGTSEYQVYKCNPGERVVINRGLQEAGIREALQRRDITALKTAASTTSASPLSSLFSGQPNWLLIGGLALSAVILLRKK